MPCLLALLAVFFPRVVMVVMYLVSDYLQTAFKGVLFPLLGFIFLPYTTLAYAFAMHQNSGSVSGIYLVIVIVAFLMDIGSTSGVEATRRRRVRVVE